jgi:hypothetical protein
VKGLILALVLLVSTGSLLTARAVWPAGGSGDTLLLSHSPTPTSTPAASQEAVRPETDGPEEPQALTHRQSVIDRFQCVNCHGPDGGWPPPSDHDSLGQDCIGCHAPAPEPPPVTVHRAPGDAATQALCSYCHNDIAGQVPPLVAQTEECSSCHEDPERRVMPEDHEGRSITTCMVCHETKQLAVPEVPHTVDDRQECSFCHGNERLVSPVGAHLSRGDDECLNCHETTLTPPDVPRRMLQISTQKEGCTGCHAEDRLAPLSVSHQDRTEALCSVCHAPTHDSAPQIPHSPGQTACARCHDPEQVGGLAMNHSGISESACTTCHVTQPGAVPAIPHEIDRRSNCTDCHAPSPGPPAPHRSLP